MAVRTDIALESNDLLIADGDFSVAESDAQHIEDTISSYPGWWKEFPLDGVGIQNYSKASGGLQQLSRKIKLELTGDSYLVDNPIIELGADGRLTINPNATRL